LGADSPEAERVLRELYAPLQRNHDKMIVMDVRSAELTKYAANAMLAVPSNTLTRSAIIYQALGIRSSPSAIMGGQFGSTCRMGSTMQITYV
jgi:hypothetical protein